MKLLFFLLAYKVIITTLLPFLPSSAWWVRVWEFPRYQIVLIGIIAFIVLLVSREFGLHAKIVSALLTAAIIYHSVLIFPYTFLSGTQVKQAEHWEEENTISLVIANVLMDNKNSSGFIDIIKKTKPDLILAVETNEWWINQLDVISPHYPFKVPVPLENTYGMVLYSKYKLIRQEVKCLVENDIPSIHVQIEMPSGKIVEGRFLHPRPPAPQESKDSKERDAEILIVAKEVKDIKDPVIVAGDLNDVAWSETTILFQKVSRLLDPRIGRGFYNTFHADYFFFRWPLDYVFHSDHFKLIQLERLPYFNSDHFAVYVKFSLDPQAKLEQEEPGSDAQEEQKATEKIKEGVNDKD